MKFLLALMLFAPAAAIADDDAFSNALVAIVSKVANAMDTGGDDE